MEAPQTRDAEGDDGTEEDARSGQQDLEDQDDSWAEEEADEESAGPGARGAGGGAGRGRGRGRSREERLHEDIPGVGSFILRRDKNSRKRRREFIQLGRSQKAKVIKVSVADPLSHRSVPHYSILPC
jgi:hypothetical protein